jgi:hypothetical protein
MVRAWPWAPCNVIESAGGGIVADFDMTDLATLNERLKTDPA